MKVLDRSASFDVHLPHGVVADFFRFALDNSTPDCELVSVDAVMRWVDDAMIRTGAADGWMTDLSLAETPDAVLASLAQVPCPQQSRLGISVFIAFVGRLWQTGSVSRSRACEVVLNCRDHMRPDIEMQAVVPRATLDAADACISQGIAPAEAYPRVDAALRDFFAMYAVYAALVPSFL